MRGRSTPFRALVRAHLRMSFRGRASQAFAGQLAGRPIGVVWLFAMYVAIGAATLPLVLGGADAFTYAVVVQLVTWMLCGLSLTAETGDALFHPAERDVLGARPIEPRVVLGAKVVVLYAFACSLVGALNLAPTLALALRVSGWAAAVHLAVAAAVVAVVTAVVAAGYGVAARVVTRERFDDVAAWSQIALALAFVGLAIAMPRATLRPDGIHLDAEAWFLRLLPPAWFAGLEVWVAGTDRGGTGLLALAAVLVLAAVAFAVGHPSAVRLAAAVARIEDEAGAPRVRKVPTGDGPLLRRWLRDPVERAAFRLASAYLRRDRDVGLRLRPSLVVFALLPLSALIVEEARGGRLVPLAAVCLLGMLPGVALEALRISSHPTASELFAVVPIERTAAVFHGARKAAIWYVVPGVALATALALAIVPRGLPLAVPGLLAMPLFTLLPGLFGPYVPLSVPKGRGQQAIANAVLLGASTMALALLVNVTLWASRQGRIVELCVAEVVLLGPATLALRALVARRGLTSRGASPTYGAR